LCNSLFLENCSCRENIEQMVLKLVFIDSSYETLSIIFQYSSFSFCIKFLTWRTIFYYV